MNEIQVCESSLSLTVQDRCRSQSGLYYKHAIQEKNGSQTRKTQPCPHQDPRCSFRHEATIKGKCTFPGVLGALPLSPPSCSFMPALNSQTLARCPVCTQQNELFLLVCTLFTDCPHMHRSAQPLHIHIAAKPLLLCSKKRRCWGSSLHLM